MNFEEYTCASLNRICNNSHGSTMKMLAKKTLLLLKPKKRNQIESFSRKDKESGD